MVAPTSGQQFERISNEIGGAGAANFWAAFGHRAKLWVPKEANDAHIIGAMIGKAAFRDLCAAFGNDWLAVPDILRALRPLRRAGLAYELSSAGATAKAIAASLGVTRDQVHRILKALKDRTPLPVDDDERSAA